MPRKTNIKPISSEIKDRQHIRLDPLSNEMKGAVEAGLFDVGLVPDPPDQDTALAIPGEYSPIRRYNSEAAVHAGDQATSWVKLLQPVSGGADGGKFLFNPTGETVDEFYLIPTLVQPTRTLWPEGGFSRDKKPDCVSSNGISADQVLADGSGPTLFPGRACITCEYFIRHKWQAEPGQRICEPGYEIRGISVASFEEIAMRLHGTANKVAPVLSRPGVFQNRPVKLYSEWTTRDWGSWFQLKAEPMPPLSSDQAKLLREILAGNELEAA